MPTAAKLIAAIVLAAVGFFAAGTVAGHLPANTGPGYLWAIASGVGLLSGWRVLGPDARGTPLAAVSAGLRATVIMVLIVLMIVSFAQMIQRSLQRHYDGPVHALQSMFGLMLDNGALLLHPDVAGVLLVGGMLAGGLAHRAARSWR
ncbi:TrgA family protein [Frigidibacter mobilis]|uniref:Tellurite resistance protein n=1 Tax=Frigidibacter mobilis TaxID=1335048 RepID=A0A159Z2R0_9RHOB|nr:TrgA family protein [Frigidibacter mobilis]AMY69271.1 tellurite resistance protein [Frigidibacter mobilis]